MSEDPEWIEQVRADLRGVDAVHMNKALQAENAALRSQLSALQEPPRWIVNDLGELGVQVGNRFYFLYKGEGLQYGSVDSQKDGVALHDDGSPMRYRMVGKREFGEVCWPLRWLMSGRPSDGIYREELVFIPGLSFGKKEDGDWRDLPAMFPGAVPGLGAIREDV